MDGKPGQISSEDDTVIGFVTAGEGPPLLLVHGGTADKERWAPVWPLLQSHCRVSAMDRRGRGDSGDGASYSIKDEFADVRLLAERMSANSGGVPVDVFGHSYGAVCVLGAAAQGAPFRRIVLYEPPGPEAVPAPVLSRLEALLAESQDEEALRFFLVDVVGRVPQDVEALRGTPGWDRRLAALRTLPREAAALQALDLPVMARQVAQPALLVLGGASPPWASAALEPLAQALPDSHWLRLPGQGHMATDMAPDVLTREVLAFLN